MSKVVRTVASIALPIIGTVVGGPIGGAVGGAIGGAVSGGGLKGAVLGAATGYVGGGGLSSTATAATPTAYAAKGASYGATASSVPTNVARTATVASSTQSVGSSIADELLKRATNPGTLINIGNQIMGTEAADTAKKAANIQSDAIDRGIAANQQGLQQQIETQRPYTEAGQQALTEINRINSDRAGYIANDPLYKTLADDAEQRLLANQAARGKVGSGETKAALQDRLLSVGNDLVTQRINSLNTQAGIGANAAGQVGTAQYNTGVNTGNMATDQGAVQAAGKVGQFNAYNSAYQNQINTLLALQSLQKTPSFNPTINL